MELHGARVCLLIGCVLDGTTFLGRLADWKWGKGLHSALQRSCQVGRTGKMWFDSGELDGVAGNVSGTWLGSRCSLAQLDGEGVSVFKIF